MRELDEALADCTEQVERLAAAIATTPEEALRALTTLRDYRCWKRIPRCFNGWGVGICALPNWHDGDCSPMPDMTTRRA